MRYVAYPVTRTRFSIEQALLSALVGLMIFFFGALAFVGGVQVWYAGRIFPGVKVAGVDVSGLRPQEAAQRISAGVTFPQQGKILLRDGEKIWVADPARLGLMLDGQASAQAAYQVGREAWLPARLRTQFYAWYTGDDIPASFVFDQRMAYQYLAGLGKEIDKPTLEAALTLNGTDVLVTPGQVGRTLDIQKSLIALSLQLQTMRDGVLDLFITNSSPVILDASQQADLARGILSQPLTLALPEQDKDGGPWTIDPPTLATMLTFQRVEANGSAQYEIRLKEDMLRDTLGKIAPGLNRTPQNARFTFNDDSKQLELIQKAAIGRAMDMEASITAIQEQLYKGVHSIPLVMTYTDPPVTDQSTGEQLGVRELVHTETSYFYGSSAARVQNIQTAASKFHGLMVAPGETFSMASALGDITLDNGYAEALIIAGGQTIKGVGGGVCQVSTTLFRTAFFGGYPVVQRYAHAYRVYYYEKVAGNRINAQLAGLDATVFVPLVDFKFTNDTPYWLLMETYVNPQASSITWKFYSTSDNRRVEWTTTGPVNVVPAPEPLYRENPDLASGEIRQVDWAADGADVSISRTVYRGDSVYFQDAFNTHYQPWQDVYEYGPGTELPTNP